MPRLHKTLARTLRVAWQRSIRRTLFSGRFGRVRSDGLHMANFPELEQRFGERDTCADCDPRAHRSQEEWSFADGSESEQTLPSTYRLSVGRSLRLVYCARHPTLDRMRDHLENKFRRRQTDRHVGDAEVLVEASNNRRENGNQQATFPPRHSSSAKRCSNSNEKVGKGQRKQKIREDIRRHHLTKHARVGGGDFFGLSAYNHGVESRVQGNANNPHRDHGCDKATCVHCVLLASLKVEGIQFSDQVRYETAANDRMIAVREVDGLWSQGTAKS